MSISSSSLSPSHPFPVPYYYPHFLLFSWTHKEYLDNTGQNREERYWPGKPTGIWTFLMLQRTPQNAGTQRINISVLALAVPPGCLPLDGTFQRWGTPVLHSQTPEWPISAAAPNAAKLHWEERKNNPPATFIALPKKGWGKSFKSPSKLLTMLYLIFIGTYLIPISTPGGFLLSSTIIIYS